MSVAMSVRDCHKVEKLAGCWWCTVAEKKILRILTVAILL